MMEGVGWGVCITTIFALLPQLFPSRVGTFSVSLLSSQSQNNSSTFETSQGVVVGGIGIGYTIGPLIGSAFVTVSDMRTHARLHIIQMETAKI